MVRKLKNKQVTNNKNYGDPSGYKFDEELEKLEEQKYKKDFVPVKPIKSDLQEVMGYGEHRKVEVLNQRYELRITELEKGLISDLKNKGINVSEELRKSLLRLNKSFVVERIEPLYFEKVVRLNYLSEEIKTLSETIMLEKYQNYTCVRTGEGYSYSNNEDEIQEMINERYAMKYELEDLQREYIQVKKFVDKYAEFFE